MPACLKRHVVYPPRPTAPPEDTSPRHGVRRDSKSWTARDDDLVLKLYDPEDVLPLAGRLGRTVTAVKTRALFLRTGRVK